MVHRETHRVERGVGERLADLGEARLLERVLGLVNDHLRGRAPGVFGVGDDAQATPLGDLWLFIKIDGTTVGSSLYPWLTLGDLGYRVALSTVSDLVAKNSRPLLLVSSVTVSGEWPPSSVLEVVAGVRDLAEAVGALYVGGDVNRLGYDDMVVDVASIGTSRNPKPGTPFREGLVVHSVRCLGLSSIPAALYYLRRDPSPWADLLRSTARPEPPLRFLEYSDLVEASTDVSDGLSSLRRVLERSGTDLALSDEALCPEIVEFSREERVGLEVLLGFMGEEYTVVSAAEYPDLPATTVGRLVRGAGRVYLGDHELRGGWDNFLGYQTT